MSKDETKADWASTAANELCGKPLQDLTRQTPEQMDVEPLYTAADLAGLDHLDSNPGQAPLTGGMRAFPQPRKQIHFSKRLFLPDKRACQLPLI